MFTHKQLRRGFLVLALFVGLSVQACKTADTSDASATSMEQSVFQQVNEFRVSRGLSKLEWDSRVADIARDHSRDMAQGRTPVGHDGFSDRVSAISAILSIRSAGENVGMTSNLDSPSQVVLNAWKNSASHLENLMGDFQITGVGICYDPGDDAWYFTQIYVQLRP